MTAVPARPAVPRARLTLHPPAWWLAVPAAVLAAVIAACSNGPVATPSGSFDPLPTLGFLGSGESPQATRWPSTVVEAVVALGAADGDLAKAGNDLNDAVQAGDLTLLLKTTDNVKTFLVGNQKNIPALQGYPLLKPVGDQLATAYTQMIAGVSQIHDSLVSGNAPGVTAGFQQFVQGSQTYGNVRAALSDAAQQAVFMKKGLNH
jgi:hypothetical protein